MIKNLEIIYTLDEDYHLEINLKDDSENFNLKHSFDFSKKKFNKFVEYLRSPDKINYIFNNKPKDRDEYFTIGNGFVIFYMSDDNGSFYNCLEIKLDLEYVKNQVEKFLEFHDPSGQTQIY